MKVEKWVHWKVDQKVALMVAQWVEKMVALLEYHLVAPMDMKMVD